MITAAQIKWIKSLEQKKFRKQLGLFVAEGNKIVTEMLESRWDVSHVFALEEWLEQNQLPSNTASVCVSPGQLQRISALKTANQVVAVAKVPKWSLRQLDVEGRFTLLLDNIQDPGNLGTILRTADWFGIEHVICSENTVELFSPKVIQASMGSFMRVKVIYTPPVDFLKEVPPGFPVMGALLEGESIANVRFPTEGVIVVGNEAKGISPGLVPLINQKLHIPMVRPIGKKHLPESLNASVAAGIIMSYIIT